MLAEKAQWIREKCNMLKAFLVVVVGGGIMVVEYVATGQYMDFHISTFFISLGVFLMAMTYPAEEPGWFRSIFGCLSEKYAWEQEEGLYVWLRPVLVLVCSCLAAFAINGIQSIFAGEKVHEKKAGE